MTAPLAHIIMLSGYGEPFPWICNICGRTWKTLPTFGDPERFTCPGYVAVNPPATTSLT